MQNLFLLVLVLLPVVVLNKKRECFHPNKHTHTNTHTHTHIYSRLDQIKTPTTTVREVKSILLQYLNYYLL
jgi:hypothetical protein